MTTARSARTTPARGGVSTSVAAAVLAAAFLAGCGHAAAHDTTRPTAGSGPAGAVGHDENPATPPGVTTPTSSGGVPPSVAPPDRVYAGITAPAGGAGAFTAGHTQVLYYPLEPEQLRGRVEQLLRDDGWTITAQGDHDGQWAFRAERHGDTLNGGIISCSRTLGAPDGSTVTACPVPPSPSGSRSQLTLTVDRTG